jgi:putative addiction module component (TIGR02574 family)
MNAVSKKLAEAARQMSAEERLQLVDEILLSLQRERDPEIEASWQAETRDRIAAYENGEMPARPAKDVLAEYLK